ncbi:MAG: glycosyltransferase family 4 protein [Cyanobacteria bacterium J06592_8]
MNKIAIIATHPIQYYAPWFRYLSQEKDLLVKVFYLWDFGTTQQVDQGFKQSIQWDIPLLSGYDYEFVPNRSSNPGTGHFWGLQNPSLVSAVKKFQPNTVFLTTYNYASIYHFILRWNSHKAPLIFRGDSHRILPKVGTKEWARRQFISLIYRQFSACLYVGKANYNYYSYHGVPAQNLFFSPHAVDNDRFISQTPEATQQAQLWKQELKIPEDHAVILFAGKFENKKRPLDLLQAFIQSNLPKVSLLLVGSGSLEHELRSQAANHPSIYFAPFQNQSQMPRTYAIADLVVLPSYGSWETWGLVINEAMCLSRPVIASNHVGCAQDLVHSNRNGLVFPAGNVSALADCLQQAFSNREQLQKWAEESRKIIRNYSYIQATQGLKDATHYLNALSLSS